MDDRLKNLRKSMDRTVFRNGDFHPGEKHSILNRVRSEWGSQEDSRRFLKWNAMLSFAVCFLLLIGLGTYALQNMNPDIAMDQVNQEPEGIKDTGGNQDSTTDVFDENGDKIHLLYDRETKNAKEADADSLNVFNAEEDSDAAQKALANINDKLDIYTISGIQERATLMSVSYVPEKGPGVLLDYHVPEADKREGKVEIAGSMAVFAYPKSKLPENSRFAKQDIAKNTKQQNRAEQETEKVEPKLEKVERFHINAMEWTYYKDHIHRDYVLTGEKDGMVYEITTKGAFSVERLKDLLKHFKK
ncbi:hypothetical protein [Pseudalkalibacillus caeni]|uniref:DUF4367 domain-containing protein n=1 Tax=Exobacillus caeni TaxID=2574798 RepID=A0A5R9FC72_9BACL|nr:hypothetical protein [Pseudalkalibacillus caeni]TLS37255.1 hypothetical protein FCL54_12075 [Pseudalkalibacillus caeni]